MKFSIRQRIWGGFSVLVLVFVVNGIITIRQLHYTKKLSLHISNVIDPTQQCLEDLKNIIGESKMYTTNWVFLRSNQEDKNALKKLHNYTFPKVWVQVAVLLPKLENKEISDSIVHILANFEKLIVVEKQIMAQLSKFEDYDDLLIKMKAEQLIEDEVMPMTSGILSELMRVSLIAHTIKVEQYNNLDNYSSQLRTLITALALIIIGIGIFLSIYFTRIITHPIGKIKGIINDLGKGIINRVDYAENQDEIGAMVASVNSLSVKLQETANFAQEVGNRNYTVPFRPLSGEDTLGKALLTMRDNIETSEKNLLKTSHSLIKRNKALEQYTYIVSHNLRGPVASILGLAEVLSDNALPPEDMKEVAAGVHSSTKRLDGIIHDLNLILDVKQQIHQVTEVISLDALVKDIKTMFSKLMENGNITITCDFERVQRLKTLKSYMVSILYNLISNSIKYRKREGELSVEIEGYEEEDKTIILFRDNGKGIDLVKNQKRIFGLYERFDLSVEGKGMGLYMIKTQVENLEGNISIESEVNVGTEFRIELPNVA